MKADKTPQYHVYKPVNFHIPIPLLELYMVAAVFTTLQESLHSPLPSKLSVMWIPWIFAMSEVKIRVFLCVRVCVCVLVEVRGHTQVLFLLHCPPLLCCPPLLVEIGPRSNLEFAEDSRLADQLAPGICQAQSHQH